MWGLAACALCTAALQLPSRPLRTRITLHAVDDDAELCVALTVHKPPRVDGTKVPSPLGSDTAVVGDAAAVLASAAAEKGDLIDRAYAAAGPGTAGFVEEEAESTMYVLGREGDARMREVQCERRD